MGAGCHRGAVPWGPTLAARWLDIFESFSRLGYAGDELRVRGPRAALALPLCQLASHVAKLMPRPRNSRNVGANAWARSSASAR